ncbi:MAG TPA: hypothetical protein VNU71_13415 [Burkholderiaceae bacterium]|nr:hypothetical protein [Burkholderiaceae bacterium]
MKPLVKVVAVLRGSDFGRMLAVMMEANSAAVVKIESGPFAGCFRFLIDSPRRPCLYSIGRDSIVVFKPVIRIDL